MRLDRRSLLIGAALAVSGAGALAVGAETTVEPLWPEGPPGGGGPGGRLEKRLNGTVFNVVTPTLTVHLPERPTGAAMIVAGGGGYRRISLGWEANPAARWLVARGITACVLTYRLPGEGWAAGARAPLQDVQRALRLLRAGRIVPGVDPERVGLFGFSAGGHLMGMAAARPDFQSYAPVDAADLVPAECAGAVLVYPVITLLPPYDRTSTRRILVGKTPSLTQAADWSVETHVRRDCAPVFLVGAADDPIANPWNLVAMEAACRKASVPVERHLLELGGHGFGMGKPGSRSAGWSVMLDPWLAARGFV
ncbi:alpha/beta hydrolase [Paenirhodobacter sp.]|uniref:alpha/beta hydrolase n=1 Tax=Paenirhodobacter sp. TaxID=1965326 RepID=UPI003B3DEF6B